MRQGAVGVQGELGPLVCVGGRWGPFGQLGAFWGIMVFGVFCLLGGVGEVWECGVSGCM